MPEEELKRIIAGELRDLMGITAEPLFCELTQLPRSMPQYPVGHITNLEYLRKQLAEEMPGVELCGGGYDGVGIPDCIRQGKQAAERMLTKMTGVLV